MIKPDQIPDEVVRAAVVAWLKAESIRPDAQVIAAALNAWPEAKRVKGYFTHDTDHYEPAIILPLPQETSDE